MTVQRGWKGVFDLVVHYVNQFFVAEIIKHEHGACISSVVACQALGFLAMYALIKLRAKLSFLSQKSTPSDGHPFGTGIVTCLAWHQPVRHVFVDQTSRLIHSTTNLVKAPASMVFRFA